MSFSGKVVIITGASSGIGAATAKLFAKENAKVVIVGRKEDKLSAVSKEIENIGNIPLVIKADVSNDKEAKRIIDETIVAYGKIDILVNNAGFGKDATILSGNILDAYDAIMATNLRAVILLTSLVTPHLIKTKGNIVNISSTMARVCLPLPETISYGVSKAALDHFSKGAALELASCGVRVNVVSPGAVDTDFNINSGRKRSLRDYAAIMPLKKIGLPEEIADVIVFLASDKAKGITGSNFVSDEGYLLTR